MIEEPPRNFLMTPRQHLEWARILHRKGRPDLAFHHEQLARVIENIARQEAAAALAALGRSDIDAQPEHQ